MIDLTKSPDKIRASILQAAMSGQLTQQLPEDGTAEDLIKEIDNEKKRLIEEGKIKKQKTIPDIEDDETPFEVPSNWKWVRLGNIGSWKSGSTPKRDHPEYYNGNIPWLKTGDLNNGIIKKTSETLTELGIEKTNLRLNPVGSVLIAMYGATIGKLGILDIDATTNQACCACIPYKGTLNKYLFYFLMSQKSSLTSLGAGGAQPNISRTKLVHYTFPIPPLAEQQRIVDKLDELLPKVDELKENTDKLEQLRKDFPNKIRQSLLQDAIKGDLTNQLPEDGSADDLLKEINEKKKRLIKEGKIKKQKALPDIEDDEIPFEIPNNWKWVRLGNIGSWKSGSTPKRDHPEYYNGNVPWLKTGDLNNGIIKNTSETITELGLKKSNLRLNPIGSVLIAMYGATIGKLGILDIEATTNQACCACIPYKGTLNKYLFYFLMSQKNSLISLGAGGAQPNISRTKLINYTFPLPPLKEQKRIVEKLDQLFSKLDN